MAKIMKQSEKSPLSMPFHVVLASDRAYAMPLATTIRSVVDNNKAHWPISFHVFCDEFSGELQHRVISSFPTGSASLFWIQIDVELFGDFLPPSHISKVTYARLLMPKYLPKEVTRVLYIDADLLVMEDIGPLWHTDIDGFVLGAVSDSGMDPAIKLDKPVAKDLPRVRSYFNAGILLIDLKRWREEQISEKSMEYLMLYPHTPFADQDALNFACDLKWKPLHARWNFQDHYEKRIADMKLAERPAIVHFVTKHKPWIPEVASPNKNLYDSFRRRTSFALAPSERLFESLRFGLAIIKNYLIRLLEKWK